MVCYMVCYMYELLLFLIGGGVHIIFSCISSADREFLFYPIGSFRLQWTRTSELVDTGGGGGISHRGLYIIRVNHSLKGTLIEDEATILTALWTRHRERAPGSHQGITPKFPTLSGGPVRGICEFDTPFFPIISCFRYPKRDTRVTHRVVKRYPF